MMSTNIQKSKSPSIFELASGIVAQDLAVLRKFLGQNGPVKLSVPTEPVRRTKKHSVSSASRKSPKTSMA